MSDPQERPARRPEEVTDEELRQFIGYSMKRVYLHVHEDLEKVLTPLGLRTRTFSALAVIIENPDITQTQLSQSLGIERSGAVVLVDELESAELISRGRVPGDRRSYALRATLAGRRLWERAEAQVADHEKAVFARLDAAERAQLLSLLHRVLGG